MEWMAPAAQAILNLTINKIMLKISKQNQSSIIITCQGNLITKIIIF